MSLEANKALVRRYYEEVRNQRNMDTADEIIAVEAGLASIKAHVLLFATCFSEFHTEILFQIAEDDLVATRWKMTGIHTGEYRGYAPTGRSFEVTGTTFHRIRDDKIVQHWGCLDRLGMVQQLGLITLAEES